MKTLFEPGSKEQILERLSGLSSSTKPAWGKMNSAQMLAHCAVAMQAALGEVKTSTGFMTLLGKMMKGRVLGPKPFGKNSPTAFKIADPRDFEKEKIKFVDALDKLSKGASAVRQDVHPFLGKLTPQEWALLNQKHIDHHFTQFGV